MPLSHSCNSDCDVNRKDDDSLWTLLEDRLLAHGGVNEVEAEVELLTDQSCCNWPSARQS